MATLLLFHLLGLYPGMLIRSSTHYIDSRQCSSLDDALPHRLPLHPKIYNPQYLPEDEHYGNCYQLLCGVRSVPHTKWSARIREKCDDQWAAREE